MIVPNSDITFSSILSIFFFNGQAFRFGHTSFFKKHSFKLNGPRNEQPWEFVVTSDKKILKKICDMCPNGPFIKDVSHLAAVFSKDTRYYIEDCSAATQNMLLAIEALGLGGCWVAGDKKNYAEDIRKIFNAPDGYKLVSMITIGYPKKEETPHAKRNLKDVLRWERYA